MALFLGIDLGTSYFKVGLFDDTGRLHGLGRVAVEPSRPGPGRCELPVSLFWHFLRRALGEALTQAQAEPAEIAAVAYASQANSFLLLDRHGGPLTPLILWTDTRAGAVPAELAALAATPEFQATVGFAALTPEFALCKWHALRRSDPALWARARSAMTMSDYLCFALTGERAGDAGTAALLGCYDLRAGSWWERALAVAGVEPGMLSCPVLPGSTLGVVSAEGGQLLGVPAGIPVAAGSLDHHAAALGAGVGSHADASISTGTVLAAVAVVADLAAGPACYHGPHVTRGQFFRLAFDPAGSGELEAYQRTQAPELSVEQLLARAAQEHARRAGAAAGPAAGGEHGAAVLAILERVARTQRRLVATVSAVAPARRVAATGGGARSTFWLQLKAHALGVPVVVPACPEVASLGAALFAAVAAGRYPNLETAAAAMVRVRDVIEPERSLPGAPA